MAWRLVCFLVVTLLAGQVLADLKPLELFSEGAEGSINGAHFRQIGPKGMGTGVLDPFVRLDNASQPIEGGYNTDGRLPGGGTPAPFDAKSDAQYTHALLAAGVGTVEIDGTTYWEFLLDINQQGGPSTRYLTLNELQIYRGNGLQNVVTETLSGNGMLTDLQSSLVWDLDAGTLGDNQINLDAKIGATGQGKADMAAYIPVGGTGDYLLLYSQFGNGFATNYPNNDGYEEWGVRKGGDPVVPAPAAVVLGMVGMSVAGWRLRRFA